MTLKTAQLAKWKYFYDFGHTFDLQLLKVNNSTLMDFELLHSSFWDWRPNLTLSVSMFKNSLFSVFINLFNVSFSISFLNPYSDLIYDPSSFSS